MDKLLSSNLRLGIISGGQLGKMLIQEASKWDITTYVLDEVEDCPASGVANYSFKGSRFDYETVYNFGKQVDLLTFEIESINTDALFQLQAEGVKIVPDPSILKLFQNKENQKEFYVKHNIPTSLFKSYNNKEEVLRDINQGQLKFPFVQKLKTGGYDGRGVAVINSFNDINLLLDGESIVEEKIEIYKEIAIIVSRNSSGEIKSYPAVDMIFDAKANLVDKLICPADISVEHEQFASKISHTIIEKLDMCGLLAIEFFIDKKGELFVNEAAPRTHNSGHHTIESVLTSQFEQHLRAILDLPLGSTNIKMPAVMINLLGEPGFEGKVKYQGLSECLSIEGVKIHLYGKKITKPYRKMGHITVLDKDVNNALKKADLVKNTLKVIV